MSYWAYSAAFWAQQAKQSALQAEYWSEVAQYWANARDNDAEEYPVSVSFGELDQEPTEEVTMVGPYIPPSTHSKTKEGPVDWSREGF